MKETRIKKIFDLLSTQEHYLTSEDLSSSLAVSSKTVRNEIKVLNSIFEKHGASVVSKAGYGFRFEINDVEPFRNFIANKWHEFAFDESSLSDKGNRVHYLLKKLAFKKSYFSAVDLCEELQISRSQLSLDLNNLKEKIEPFHVQLEVRPNYGIRLVASEMNLRLCIANVLYNENKNPDSDVEFETQWVMEQIRKNVLTVFDEFNYETSEIIFENLITHLFIALERIKIGEPILMDLESLEELKLNDEYQISKIIIERMSKSFNLVFPEDELGYITMHLSGKRVFAGADNSNVVSSEVDQLVTKMIERIHYIFEIDFSRDLDLRVALGLHCVPLIKRIQYHLLLKNPLLEDIKKHKQAFLIAKVATEEIERTYNTKLAEDEVAYFALHFYVALERHKENTNKKKVLLVCATGHGTAKLLNYRFKKEFEAYLDDVQTIDALTIQKLNLEKFDLIVSTVPLRVKTTKPIIYISSLLDDKDVQSIKLRFSEDKLSIAEFFDRRLFFKDFEAKTKEEIIYFMSNKITELYGVKDGFYESCLVRESMASTEFGNLIAIPHPDKSFTSHTIVSVTLLKEPIIWKEREVQLVFMLSYGDSESDNLDTFFAKSAHFLTDAKEIQKAIQVKDYEEFIKIIDWN